MSNKLQIPEDIRVDLTGATPGQIAALQELSVRLNACQNDKESLFRQVEKLNNRLATAQSEREYFRSQAAFFQEASSHCPHIISVSGYKAFHGTMCIAPSGQTPYYLTGDWLYKPEFDCWYGKGRSFPASVCTVSEA